MAIYGKHFSTPENTPVWGCHYDTISSRGGMGLICKPVRGMIINVEKQGTRFVEFKKNGKGLKKSGIVNPYSREYADTYEECVELYNLLIQREIDSLQRLIASHTEEFIEV